MVGSWWNLEFLFKSAIFLLWYSSMNMMQFVSVTSFEWWITRKKNWEIHKTESRIYPRPSLTSNWPLWNNVQISRIISPKYYTWIRLYILDTWLFNRTLIPKILITFVTSYEYVRWAMKLEFGEQFD